MGSEKNPKVCIGSKTKIRGVYRNVLTGYIENPNKYVYSYDITVNGKSRRIITYKSNRDGAALRYLHREADLLFRYGYTPCDNSFAYIQGRNIKSCLSKHINNNVFLKMDIHSYFDTISQEILKDKVISYKIGKAYKKDIVRIIEGSFFEGHMPIGFITSPILSDIYLHDLDQYFSSRTDVIYTRYADDIIVSCSGENAEELLTSVKQTIVNHLAEIGLEINARKTYIRRLRAPGDAIHLLGLNLVYCDSGINRITVSDRYIRETSIAFCEYCKNKSQLSEDDQQKQFAAVYGKINFISNASKKSAEKFRKMLQIKLSQPIQDLTYETLNNISFISA